MNRLAEATSPYLLQHADNPVDWWQWCDEAFAEAKRRDVPVLISVGYAACHWCHVMAHESFEDEAVGPADERRLRLRQGRPRGAPRRRRGLHDRHPGDDRAGRLADDRLRHAGRHPVLLRHVLPARATSSACSARSPPPGATSARRCCARAPPWSRRSAARRPSGGVTAPLTADLLDAAASQLAPGVRRDERRFRRRAEVPAAHEPAVPAPAPPAHRLGAQPGDRPAHLRGDGPRRHLRPARRRVRPLLGGRPLDRAALREDALRQRAAAARLHPALAADRRPAGPPGGPGHRPVPRRRAAPRR